MTKLRTFPFRLSITLTALALSACNAKSTTFNKALSTPGEHSSIAKVSPQNSPSPVPSALPAVIAPPQPIHWIGNYVSVDSDLEIAATKNFVMHSEALSALSSSPNSQTLCKIERDGTIDSIITDGASPAIHFNITSEKFSAAQPGSANDNFCAEVEKSFSQAHELSVPIAASGKGFLILKLNESSGDGLSLTTTPGVLSELFFDRDSIVDLNEAFLQIFSGNFTGAYGGFLAVPSVPRLTLEIDSKTGKFDLVDNECAFSITGLLKASGNSGSLLVSAPNDSIKTATLNTVASKTYSVYFGRLSGGCVERKQNFISQLTGAGIKVEPATQTGKYNLDFSALGGEDAKYIIQQN